MPLGELGEGHAPRLPGRPSRDKTRVRLGCNVFVRAFSCPTCGRLVFFENSECLHCGTALAYDPSGRELEALNGRPRCLNAEIIRHGYGFAYVKYAFPYMDQYRALEREARDAGRGLRVGVGVGSGLNPDGKEE